MAGLSGLALSLLAVPPPAVPFGNFIRSLTLALGQTACQASAADDTFVQYTASLAAKLASATFSQRDGRGCVAFRS